jgi:hypothetical protein
MRRKGVLQVIFRKVEGKVSNEQFCAHLISVSVVWHFQLFPRLGSQINAETYFHATISIPGSENQCHRRFKIGFFQGNIKPNPPANPGIFLAASAASYGAC